MKDFFDDEANVKQYIDMCEDYDPSFIAAEMMDVLVKGKSVLELGSGPGKDLRILKDIYEMTGSDRSPVFVELLKKEFPELVIKTLDAVTIEVDETYDCIFSNKVLQHLSKEDMTASINKQLKCLNQDGMIIHTLWFGEGEESYNGLRFVYYNEEDVKSLLGKDFDITIKRYTEMDTDDSLLVIGRRR